MKDVEAMVSYWQDTGAGSPPDPNQNVEMLMAYADEVNRNFSSKISEERSLAIIQTNKASQFRLFKKMPPVKILKIANTSKRSPVRSKASVIHTIQP
jgi:hypothetical protein